MHATPSRRAAKQDLCKTLPLHGPSFECFLILYGSSCKATAGNRETAYCKPKGHKTRMMEDWFSKRLQKQKSFRLWHNASICDESPNPIALRAAQGGTQKWVPKWYLEKWPCDAGRHPLKHHANIRRSSEMHLCMYSCMHKCMHGCMHEKHAWMHECMKACMHGCQQTWVHLCMHPGMHPCMHSCMHSYMHPCMHPCVHPCLPAGIHACIHACIYASMHTDTEKPRHRDTETDSGRLRQALRQTQADSDRLRQTHTDSDRLRHTKTDSDRPR